MSLGERAVVVAENPHDNTRPLIHVIANCCEGTFKVLDLADVQHDSLPKIVGYLNPDKEGIDLTRFLGGGEHRMGIEPSLSDTRQ